MLRTLRQMKTSLKNWFQTFSLLFHVIQLLKSREIIKLELRRAERGPRPSTETVTFIAFVVTFFKSTKLVFVSWAKLVFMMHVQSFFLPTETPFYTGLDKLLNGQKLAMICLTFTRDLRDLAMSFERQTVLLSAAEFARFRVNGLHGKKIVHWNILPEPCKRDLNQLYLRRSRCRRHH